MTTAETRAARTVLPTLLALAIVTRYSRGYGTAAAMQQYFHGVYAPRWLGRELIEGVAAVSPGGLLTGWMVVNGLSYVAFAALLHRATRGHLGLYLVGLGTVIVSAGTITPYDWLSYALITGFVAEALRPAPRLGLVAVLATGAICTRESMLIGVAVVVVARGLAPVSRLVAGVGVGGYVLLHWMFSAPSWQVVALERNLRPVSFSALLLAGLLVLSVRAVSPRSPQLERQRRLLWLLCTPYLVVVGVGGIWSEAPRLVMPLVIGELLLAAAMMAPWTGGTGSPAAGETSASRVSVAA